jgi:hypothetical protein
MMRTTSNHSREVLQQLHIALLGGLTCKLLSLYYQIKAIKSELEVHCTTLVVYHIIDDRVSAGSRQTTA